MVIQALICGLVAEQAQSADRTIHIELVVGRTPSEMYKLWTTESGLSKWFAPAARVDPRVGGRYEIIFDPDTISSLNYPNICALLGPTPLGLNTRATVVNKPKPCRSSVRSF